jgi:hypothetical protein
MEEPKPRPRPTSVHSGNPRITVSFPFSKIDIHEPTATMSEVAGLVAQLADQVAELSHQLAADGADAADNLAEEARQLATRLGAGTG